jgi:peptidase M28-like protein
MKKIIPFVLLAFFSYELFAQTNILLTNTEAEQILLGNFDPADYTASTILNHPDDIISGVRQNISALNMKNYLIELSSFNNRNTGSDTLSLTSGIGAARRWVFSKFEEFSTQSENRLIPFYMQFDQNICGAGQHRNICAVLPGLDAEDHSVIIIEAHLDSRCAEACDIECDAHGMEDNGSGTALVIELARVMSQYSFNSTIVFMATIGEEQGLYGANAFAEWVDQNSIPVKAIFNNDIVGGIICGETSSEPSCPGFNDVDSTQVRIFSGGSANSPHKSLARFSKLEYTEEVLPTASVPMLITLMSALDRTGRGGDHIPFHDRGYTSLRFTSANEHGNANASDPEYHDRQHTSDDILGVDTDGDMVLDSFFVDFNYMARNAVINGVASGMAAIGPKTPPSYSAVEDGGVITVVIDDPYNYNNYRIGVRHLGIDFYDLIDLNDTNTGVYFPDEFGAYYLSVCSVDSNGIESLFSNETLFIVTTVGVEEEVIKEDKKVVQLLQNRPNPFDEATYISFMVNETIAYQKAAIVIRDMSGKEIQRLATTLNEGLNEILYEHGYNVVGTFVYSLEVDGNIVDSRQMVFAN